MNRKKTLDCRKGLLNSLTTNIKHFSSNLGVLTLSCSKKFRDLLIYVVTVLPLPHTMPVLNAMQLQRDDLAP